MSFVVGSRTRFFRFIFLFFLLLCCDLLLFAQSPGGGPVRYPLMPDAQVRNVILFIGDGMGLAHLSASRMHNEGANGWYTIECMPVTSLVRTNSADNIITDSAAGATAYATGHKTNNKMIAVAPDSTRLKTIVEAAREKGMATGLVTMGDDLTGATPAAFATHVPRRSLNEEIASQFARSGVDVLVGRDEKFFVPDSNGGIRKDGRNIVNEMQQNGYHVVHSIPELESTTSKKVLGFLRLESYNDDKIVHVTEKAITMLCRNKKGFFLMVECPLPDHGAHSHDSNAVIDGIQQLDHAVKTALDFAQKDKHTLVLVTADHETGGLALLKANSRDSVRSVFMTESHTAIPVPLFAFGPHALRFTGMKDNTEVASICGELLRLRGFPDRR